MEVAGVALAVFPLVIQGISNLVEAASTVKKFKHYHRELKRDARMIENEWTGFQLSMENLVSCIGHSYEDSQALLKNPGGAVWSEPKFRKKLKSYLDEWYHPFVQTVEDLVEDLEVLCEKLNIDSHTRQIQNVDVFRDSINRFKHTFGQSVYKEIFDRIRGANDFLRRTTFQSQASQTWRAQGKSRMKGASLARLRQQAVILHRNLARQERWSCQCKDRHLLSLYLGPLDSHLAVTNTEPVVFEVAFGTTNVGTPELSLSNAEGWRMVKVECEVARDDEAPQTLEEPASKLVPKVKFELDQIAPEKNKESIPETIISDLCAAINLSCASQRPGDVYLGHLKAELPTEHRHGLFRTPWPWLNGRYVGRVSGLLTKLGTANHVRQEAAIFPRRSRLVVAAQLALGVLVLDGSWLKQGWTSDDILVIRGALQSKSANNAMHEEDVVLIPWKLQEDATDLLLTCTRSYVGSGSVVRCAALFALGLTLIELSLGARLEDLQEEQDQNPDEVVSKRRTAFRLLPRVEEEEGETYANVIERCLDCPFDVARRDLSFDNAKFRELVFETIVKPLKENAAVFTRR
jgi:hypothetical protein